MIVAEGPNKHRAMVTFAAFYPQEDFLSLLLVWRQFLWRTPWERQRWAVESGDEI